MYTIVVNNTMLNMRLLLSVSAIVILSLPFANSVYSQWTCECVNGIDTDFTTKEYCINITRGCDNFCVGYGSSSKSPTCLEVTTSNATTECACECSGDPKGPQVDLSACTALCNAGETPTCPPITNTNTNTNTDDNNKTESDVSLSNPLPTADVPTIIGKFIRGVLGVVGSIALIFFMYGGFMYLTAGGSSERVGKGRQTLVWASIGLLIIFTSYAILNFIFGALL